MISLWLCDVIDSTDALAAGAAGKPERPRIVLEALGSNDAQADLFHNRSDLGQSILIGLRVAFWVAGIAVFFFFRGFWLW
jgi:hypothetical protein